MTEAGDVQASLKSVRQERFDPRLGVESGTFDLSIDRIGLVKYSTVAIRLDWPVFQNIASKLSGGTDSEVVRNVALSVVNRVIDVYRHAAKIPWVRRIVPQELFQLRAEVYHDDGTTSSLSDIVFVPGGITLPITGLVSRAEQEFVQHLRSGFVPPIWDEFWLDAEDAAQRGDIRSAVVWGHTALEVLAHAAVLAWLRESFQDVHQAAMCLGHNSEIGRLRGNLSLEELATFLDDVRKVEIALSNIIGFSEQDRLNMISQYENMAAERNAILHRGRNADLFESEEHLKTLRGIRAALATAEILEKIRTSKPQDCVIALKSLSNDGLNQGLAELITTIQDTGLEVTLWTNSHYPLKRDRHGDLIAFFEDAKALQIYLPKRDRLAKTRWQADLARFLFRRQLVRQENWPRAVVNRLVIGPKSAIATNLEAYKYVADRITNFALDREINRRLLDVGLDINPGIKDKITELDAMMNEVGFTEPAWGEPNYYLLTIDLLALALDFDLLSLPLVALAEQKVPNISRTVNNVKEGISKLSSGSPSDAATTILLLKNALLLLDAVGVQEPNQSGIRTRLNDDERGRRRGSTGL